MVLTTIGKIIAGLYFLTIVFTALVVILDKRDPTKAMLWVFVLVLVPVAGLVFYIFFGQNLRRKQSARRHALQEPSLFLRQVSPYSVDLGGRSPVGAGVRPNLPLARLIRSNSHAPVLGGNRVEHFHQGRSAFHRLIEDLEAAEHFIHMEYYIFRSDELGRRISDILQAKAQAGLEVRVIYDSVGSWGLSKAFIRRMRRAGIRVLPFQQVIFPFLGSRLNNRNHRKILVIDGRVAYMGGMNIADRYIYGTPLGQWTDTQLRLSGPSVLALHHVFLSDWRVVSRARIEETPPARPFEWEMGTSSVQILASGPDTHWSRAMQAFFLAITQARRYIYICTPYFIPNESLLTALRTASLSGVDVRLLLPARSDSRMVLWASRSYIGQLLDAGIGVYLFSQGFNHSKTLMVDGTLSVVGSANMDIRSFEDNFEVVAYIYDSELTRALELDFIKNAQQSLRLTPEEWRERPILHRVKDSFARLLSPLF